MRLLISSLFILILGSFFVSAYYADLDISVTDSGSVTVTGLTNVEKLLVSDSQEFTSKQGPYWVLNFTFDEVFDDVVYEIHLPKNAVVNYMKLPSFGRIQENNGITISGAASDVLLSLVVQYQLSSSLEKDYTWIFGVVFIILILLFVGYYTLQFKKEQKVDSLDSSSLDFSRYSSRQEKILRLLHEHGGELSQATLEKLTGFPKSSLSRNIASLQRKGVVEKFNKGMSNSIRVK